MNETREKLFLQNIRSHANQIYLLPIWGASMEDVKLMTYEWQNKRCISRISCHFAQSSIRPWDNSPSCQFAHYLTIRLLDNYPCFNSPCFASQSLKWRDRICISVWEMYQYAKNRGKIFCVVLHNSFCSDINTLCFCVFLVFVKENKIASWYI